MTRNNVKSFVRMRMVHILYALIVAILLSALVILVSGVMVNHHRKYMSDSPEELSQLLTGDKKVALVLGGGIGEDSQPTDVVKSRLDAVAILFFEGVVNEIIVSGDNRFVSYNEPQVMQNYLQTEYDIPLDSIQQDSAGRSTYESCDRAKNVFMLDELIVVSQQSHVPRAIFLCRSFGIKAYGFPSPNNHHRISQSLREIAANVKAVYNVYLFGEPTVYGDQIEL